MATFLKFIVLCVLLFVGITAAMIAFDPQARYGAQNKAGVSGGNPAIGQCLPLTMYSMSWCGACKLKRAEMVRAGVVFREYVLDESPARERDFKRRIRQSGGGAYGYPTFEVNGRFIANYPLDYLLKLSCEERF